MALFAFEWPRRPIGEHEQHVGLNLNLMGEFNRFAPYLRDSRAYELTRPISQRYCHRCCK